MKPRRWYSSPEMKPTYGPYMAPFASLIQTIYAARTRPFQGPMLKFVAPKLERVVSGPDPQAQTVSPIVRRIEAA